jgi:polysaccharide biosynthesis/export protein
VRDSNFFLYVVVVSALSSAYSLEAQTGPTATSAAHVRVLQSRISREYSLRLYPLILIHEAAFAFLGSPAFEGDKSSGKEREKVSAPPADRDAPAAGYILGPDDQVSIRVTQAPELIDKPVRIGLDGYMELPFAGRVKASGLTVEELRIELVKRLLTTVHDPEVSVSIEDYRSQPVSVLGAVTSPGVHQIRGRKTIIEALSLAGGLRQDSGNMVTITRRLENGRIGIRGETEDLQSGFRVAHVDISALMEGRNPEDNVLIQPNDVISVPRSRMLYVFGEVPKAGGFVMGDRDQMSVLEALSLAGGMTTTAAPKKAKILRASDGESGRTEIDIDIHKIVAGKARDQQLKAQDVLFIPSSASKRASIRALEAAIQVGTGMAVWRR